MLEILDRAREGRGISPEDMYALLSVSDPGTVSELFSVASEVKRMYFGNRVFLYGFVYFSTYCRNDCAFCNYRNSHAMGRYRKSVDEVVSLSSELRDGGVNMVDLTMGEDPVMYGNGYERLTEVVRSVDSSVDIPIMLSPGAISKGAFPRIRAAGADWFACYQETHNRGLFGNLRPDQDFDLRSNQRMWAKENGMLTEDGIMIGVGETRRDIVDSMVNMGEQGCDQVRVMTFVPQEGTPMSGRCSPDRMEELKAIAVLRLAYPRRLIPASLDIEGSAGLVPRLDAGANVVTSIIPPDLDLAGVAQKDLEIDSGKRSVQSVFGMLDRAGQKAAGRNEYRRFMEERASC